MTTSRVDPAEITFSRSRYGGFRVHENIRFPPRAVNLFECERLDSVEYAMDRGTPERNEIRIAAHEADVSAVLHDLNDVAGEQRAPAPPIAGRRRPVQDGATL